MKARNAPCFDRFRRESAEIESRQSSFRQSTSHRKAAARDGEDRGSIVVARKAYARAKFFNVSPEEFGDVVDDRAAAAAVRRDYCFDKAAEFRGVQIVRDQDAGAFTLGLEPRPA